MPVILFDYQQISKHFMRLNEDGKTVRAMDILSLGGIVGGSQREERFDVWSKNES
jgi:asparaginyl-tRNA synthetase